MWHVYILLCGNGDYYKGCTNDLDRRIIQHQSGKVESTKELLPVKNDLDTRIIQHQSGKVESTKDLLPLKLITYVSFSDKSKAYEFEKYLKTGSGRAFLKKHLV